MGTPVIFIRERVWESWLRDGFSFGCLIGLMWFNANYCGGSGWIYATSAIIWFVWILSKASKHHHVMTPAEAREWLNANFPDGA